MSRQLINSYYNQLHKIKQFGGSRNEGAVSRAFATLLDAYAGKKNLMLVEQVDIKTPKGNTIRPDGVVKNAMRLDFGFWEAKKGDVDLEKEIQLKIERGYPLVNILFEDSNRVVLYQENQRVLDVPMNDDAKLDEILTRFIEFEPLQIKKFNEALGKFKAEKENGVIYLDSATSLHGVPAVAWEYKLGNRSALEWILDQYKEKKPKDKTIAERFNTYRFADYKEQVIDLLQRVCAVSVKTMEIIGKMKAEE